MSGTIQCPQCGAVSSTKISDTEYHCTYCESSFTIGMSKEEMIANILKKSGMNQRSTSLKFDSLTGATTEFNQEKLEAMRQQATVDIVAAKKTARRVGLIVLIIILGVSGIIFYSVHKAISGTSAIVNNVMANSTVSKFKVFSGSKGPVIWMLQEQSVSMNDSTHFILSIIDPPSKKHLQDIAFIPAMTWEDAFNSSKYMGDFYGFGDTCWIVSEQFGLTARDIYTGKIIIDAKRLSQMHPELQKGVTKAEWGYDARNFSVMTNDGFEFLFFPDQNKIIKKDDYDKRDKSQLVTKNFFILTDSKRPELYITSEKTAPLENSSRVFSSELADYEAKKEIYGMGDYILSINHALPDLIFFNGFVIYSDNDKAVVAYQNTVAKNSPLHFSCIDTKGKILWNLSGNDVKPFEKDFADNNRAVNCVASKNVLALFEDYSDHDAIGVDWSTGKVLWNFTTKKDDK